MPTPERTLPRTCPPLRLWFCKLSRNPLHADSELLDRLLCRHSEQLLNACHIAPYFSVRVLHIFQRCSRGGGATTLRLFSWAVPRVTGDDGPAGGMEVRCDRPAPQPEVLPPNRRRTADKPPTIHTCVHESRSCAPPKACHRTTWRWHPGRRVAILRSDRPHPERYVIRCGGCGSFVVGSP